MRVKGVSWVGVRTEQFSAMASFFRDVVGLDATVDEQDFIVFRMPNGDQLEIFGARGPNPAEQFAHNEVVAGLLVDDLDAATAELVQAGIERVGERQTTGSGYSWQHFRAPDGKVFELCYEPER